MLLPCKQSNASLPRDRRGYSPLYYRGLLTFNINTLRTGDVSLRDQKQMLNVPIEAILANLDHIVITYIRYILVKYNLQLK
jgi:hypothetical protein